MHATGRMRSSDMSSTDKRRSNVLNGSGQSTWTHASTIKDHLDATIKAAASTNGLSTWTFHATVVMIW